MSRIGRAGHSARRRAADGGAPASDRSVRRVRCNGPSSPSLRLSQETRSTAPRLATRQLGEHGRVRFGAVGQASEGYLASLRWPGRRIVTLPVPMRKRNRCERRREAGSLEFFTPMAIIRSPSTGVIWRRFSPAFSRAIRGAAIPSLSGQRPPSGTQVRRANARGRPSAPQTSPINRPIARSDRRLPHQAPAPDPAFSGRRATTPS